MFFLEAGGNFASSTDKGKNLGTSNGNCPIACAGNPINSGTGNKFQVETDFVGGTSTYLELKRTYNSQDATASAFGQNWHSTWHRSLTLSGTKATVTRADGRQDTFTLNGSTWTADPDVTSVLSGSATAGWTLVTPDDTTEKYGTDGRLLSLTTRAGLVTNLTYDASNRLTKVTGPFGYFMQFVPNATGNVGTMITPANESYTYAYDAKNNLTSVTYPDGSVRTYVYENAGFPNALTGIIDELGVRFATYAYDAKGRATSSKHAGDVDLTTITYNADGSVNVADPRGNTHGYNFVTQFGMVKPTAVSGAPVQTVGAKAFNYDTNGFIKSRTDFNGNVTTYVNDPKGLEKQRIEAYGTALARTINTDWHATFRLPTLITEPNRTTQLEYDSKGNLLKKTITAAEGTRVWANLYNAYGQVTQIDGPRTDVSDITRFDYDAKGNWSKITDALGRATLISSYDGNGRPLTVQDPNGLVTQFTYDKRGRIKTRMEGTETTTFTYDLAGNLTKVTQPDGAFLSYRYDAAHRLTEVVDALGNYLRYTLDAAGNRVQEQAFTAANAVARTRSYEYDNVNRLKTAIGAQSQRTLYGYDDNGNQKSVTDPLGYVTGYGYDALNRLAQTVDQNQGASTFGYDANDNLKQVADPRGLITSYSYDGLGNRLQTTSPDTGLAKQTFDGAGNVATSTDARGKQTIYSYDALNRKTKATFADGSSVTWVYDQGTNGIGRLTSMTDPTGSTAWTYDQHGRVLSRQQITGGVTLTTRYSYDASGRLSTLTYPSAKVLTLGYDANGQVNRISLGGTVLLSQAAYQPFGQVSSWTEGNGTLYQRTIDQDGRIAGISFTSNGAVSMELTYDAASYIQGIAETGQASKNFDYDPAGHLKTYTTPTDVIDLGYDADGNRTQSLAAAGNTTYSYPATSNRLTSITGLLPQSGLAAGSFVYDARGRMTQATVGSLTTTYGINGLGQRVSKSGSGTTLFVYGEAGHLLGEYNAVGQAIQETAWFGDTPVAVLTSGGTYYVNANHLNAPHVITNSSAQPVWTWDPLAFGDNPPTGSFTYNLRFPGQYYDAETGLHYNYYRDYNPALGRYVQSDPIGLDGGVNTYAYVGGNPVSVTDQNGNIAAGLFFLCAANPVCRAGMIGVGTFAIDVVYQGYENGIGKINYKEAIIAASINAGVSLFYPIVGVPTAPVLGPGIAKLAVKEIEFVNSMNEQQANAIRDALSRGGHPQASAAVNPNCAR